MAFCGGICASGRYLRRTTKRKETFAFPMRFLDQITHPDTPLQKAFAPFFFSLFSFRRFFISGKLRFPLLLSFFLGRCFLSSFHEIVNSLLILSTRFFLLLSSFLTEPTKEQMDTKNLFFHYVDTKKPFEIRKTSLHLLVQKKRSQKSDWNVSTPAQVTTTFYLSCHC